MGNLRVNGHSIATVSPIIESSDALFPTQRPVGLDHVNMYFSSGVPAGLSQ